MRLSRVKLDRKTLILIGVFLFVIDRAAKLFITPQVINSGIALGVELFAGSSTFSHLAIWTVLIAALSFWWARGELLLFPAILAAASNLIDRIVLGGVVDYLRLGNMWLNLADIVIVTTVLILVFKIYANKNRN